MMNRFLKNKKGVTILEGLIALGLLALVAGGTFGVLLSVSRKASNPDIREEMILAVERANEQLQMYTRGEDAVPEDFKKGLCKESSGFSEVLSGKHDIPCMLPAICDSDPQQSSFSYKMGTSATMDNPLRGLGASYSSGSLNSSPYLTRRTVEFTIKCNGFTL